MTPRFRALLRGTLLAVLVPLFLMKSAPVDAGTTLGRVTGPGVGGQVHAFAFDPDDATTAYAGGDVCGVYRYSTTDDRWAPWSAGLGFGDLNLSFYVDDLLVLGADSGLPYDSQGVYAATWGGIYFRSRAGGEWQCLTDSLTYDTGYARVFFDNTGARASALRIPFCALAYDRTNRKLYAGAGHGRIADALPDTLYSRFYPTSGGPGPEYTLWVRNLSVSGSSFHAVSGTAHGKARQVAVARFAPVAGDSTTEVLYACDSGVFAIESTNTPENVWPSANKTAFDELGHSSDPWGVGVGRDGRAYALMSRDVVNPELDPGLWRFDLTTARDTTSWHQVVGPNNTLWPYPDVTWTSYANGPKGDLSELTVIPGTGASADEIFVGETRTGSGYGLFGYFRYGTYTDSLGVSLPGWVHFHRTENDQLGMGNNRVFAARVYDGPVDQIELTPDILGWHSFYPPLRALVPFAVHPRQHDLMVAVDYAMPLITDDGGQSWTNLYCKETSGGWVTKGLNLMCATSATCLSDGRLVMGAQDYGAFIGTDSGNSAYLHLHDPDHSDLQDGSPPYWPKTRDVEAVFHNGQHEIYMVDYQTWAEYVSGQPNPIRHDEDWIWLWDAATHEWKNVSGRKEESGSLPRVVFEYLNTIGGGDAFGVDKFGIVDMEFVDTETMLVTVYGNVKESARQNDHLEHHLICKGARIPGTTEWTWSVLFDPDPGQHGTAVINRLAVVPGTTLVLYGAKYKGYTGGSYEGGLYCLDYEQPTGGTRWLGGDRARPEPLWRLGNNVTAVTVDRLGRYAYAGCSGHDTPWSAGQGGVVRFRLEGGAPADTTIIAGEFDVFGLDDTRNFPGPPNNCWQWCTRIADLALDPHNPLIVHAAVGNRGFFDADFGAWRFANGTWNQITGDGDTGSGAASVNINPVDPSKLYVGSLSQEFFVADIPVASHPAIADSLRFPLLAATSDTVQVLAVPIAADTTVVTVEAALDGLGLLGTKLVLLDDGEGDDLAANDGVFTSPRFPALLTAGTGHSVRVFAQDATGGYDEREVAVEAVAGYARFVDVSKGTGDLYSSLPDSADHQPYSSVYFDATSDAASRKVMVVTFDDNVTPPQMFERWYVDDETPWFEKRSGQVYPAWTDTLYPGSRGLAAADFDNDANPSGVSDTDFFICNPASGGRLFRSHFAQGTELFTDVTDVLFGAEAGELAGAITASWGNFDDDGFVDLAVATTTYVNPVKNLGGTAPNGTVIKVFRNVGGVRFERLPYNGISGGPNICLSMDWVDLDQDGDEDLVPWHYLSWGGTFLMLNLGHNEILGQHVMVPSSLNIQDTWAGGMSVCEIDYDHDLDAEGRSYPDLLVTESYGERRAMVLRNLMADGSPTLEFETITLAGGRDWSGAVADDFDLNGQIDALCLPQDGQPELRLGTAGGTAPTYRDLAFTAGLRPGATSGALTQDLNDDDKPDLFLGRIRGDQFLYRSAPVGVAGAGPAHWLRVDLGTVGNSDRSLLGTAVMVTAGGISQTRVVSGGGGRGGQPSNELLFGLGAAAGSAEVTVRYRSGEIDQFTTAVDTTAVAMEDQPVVLKPSTKNDPNPVFSYELAPGNATWVFRWRTVDIKGDLARDVVHVENHLLYEASDPCYIGIAPGAVWDLKLNDPGVAHTVYRSGEYWQHEVRWGALPCQEDCVYRFWVTSGLGNGETVSSPPKLITPIDYCIPDLQE